MSVSHEAMERLAAHWAVVAIPASIRERTHDVSRNRLAHELLRVLPAPADDHGRVFHVLHHGALAYCSDRWTDLRRWMEENPALAVPPSVASATWDHRILFRLHDCWIRLFRKNQWDDLDGVREIVAGLREDQKHYESTLLASVDPELDQHFGSARKAAQTGGDASLDVILRWLHVASRRMVASSKTGDDRTAAEGHAA